MATPFKFKESNKVLRAPPGMKGCTDMAIFSGDNRCISAHKLSWRERFSALFFGVAWLDLISGPTQPPCKVTVTRNYFKKP